MELKNPKRPRRNRISQVKPKFQSFTFERRRPFSSKRLQRLLEQWQDQKILESQRGRSPCRDLHDESQRCPTRFILFFPVCDLYIYICNMYVNSYYVCLSRDVPLTQLRQTPSPAMRFCGKRLKRLHFQIIHIWYNCIYKYIYIIIIYIYYIIYILYIYYGIYPLES